MLKSMLTQDATVSREQLREQIKKSVEDAQAAARKAATEAAQAAEEARGSGQGGPVIVVRPGQPPIGVPVVGRPFDPEIMIPPQVENISIAFFVMVAAVIIGYPLMRAIARRIDRGAPPPAVIPNELREQLHQLSASVEAIAIEVERISEGQRFTTKMLAEKTPEGTLLTPSPPK
jgi:hypothetical protein